MLPFLLSLPRAASSPSALPDPTTSTASKLLTMEGELHACTAVCPAEICCGKMHPPTTSTKYERKKG